MSAKFLKFQLRLTDGLRAVTTAGLAERFRIRPSDFEVAQGLAHGDQADAEMLGDVRFLRQFAADGKMPVGDRLAQDIGELPVQRTVGAPEGTLGRKPRSETGWSMSLSYA